MLFSGCGYLFILDMAQQRLLVNAEGRLRFSEKADISLPSWATISLAMN